MSQVLQEANPRSVREFVTPEGIPLRFELASIGDRAAAFFIDILVWGLVVGALMLLLGAFEHDAEDAKWARAVVMLFTFVSRVFYFIWFETRGGGATPGKRRIGIRVMDRGAEPLTTDAIVVRNFMRELEVWIPLAFILSPQALWPDAPAIVGLVSMGWMAIIVLLPIFNRDRLRAGDMVAGTVVVLNPKPALLADIGGREVERAANQKAQTYTFTRAQLKVYGIYELQVLEELLRRNDPYKRDAVQAVCKRIQRRIEWKGEAVRNERFLREFYAALRAHLEQRMLLGKRKQNKHTKD